MFERLEKLKADKGFILNRFFTFSILKNNNLILNSAAKIHEEAPSEDEIISRIATLKGLPEDAVRNPRNVIFLSIFYLNRQFQNRICSL